MTKTATVHAQQRWEYLEMTRKTAAFLVKEMNGIGQQGWELVSVMQAKDRKGEMGWTAILKRPAVSHGAPPPEQKVAVAKPDSGLHEEPRIEPSAAAAAEFELEEAPLQFREEPPEETPPGSEQ